MDWYRQRTIQFHNQCDYISFFDDDILIEKDYFLFIERAFKSFQNDWSERSYNKYA